MIMRCFALVLAITLFSCQDKAASPGSTIGNRPTADAKADATSPVKLNQAVGSKAPEFALKDLDGTVHKPEQWRGKVLVVNFWATWCPPCKKEMPLFVELQKQYGDRGLQFIGIALDREQMVQDFTSDFELNYPILIGTEATVEVMTRYGNHLGALPFTAVVDRQGNIRHIHTGEVTRQIAKLKILSQL